MPITRVHNDDDVVEPYNIIPIHNHTATTNLIADHPSLRVPEVRAAVSALRSVGDLRRPPSPRWHPGMDLLDWLALFFGFQNDNVRNQREHLVLHLANAQMRLSTPPDNIAALDATVLRSFRVNLLSNYTRWCSYLSTEPNLFLSDASSQSNHRRELLYVSLYLLIWGEAANLRFLPECICYIFHYMAMDLNRILHDHYHHEPSIPNENGFLESVVKPIYQTMLSKVESSRNGTVPHCEWRNYDDINEYFWSKRCFEKLKWPIDLGSNFFVFRGREGKRGGKTGFVERRSF